MALIKCIECGMQVSTYAKCCPNCGCPSEYQSIDLEIVKRTEQSNTQSRLINNDEWIAVNNLVSNNDIFSAITKIREITGCSLADANEIRKEIKETGCIPEELIIGKFPKLENKPTTTACTACSRSISAKAETCPHCGNPTGVHVCPKCGSTNTHVIVGVDKAISVALWGRFAANEVMSKYACYDCKHKW